MNTDELEPNPTPTAPGSDIEDQLDADRQPGEATGEQPIVELADGNSVIGGRSGGTITVEYQESRPVHHQSRRHLKADFKTNLRIRMMNLRAREGEPAPTAAEINAEFERHLAITTEHRKSLQPALDQVSPELVAPDAGTVDRGVELAAVLRLPVMVWVWLRLLTWSSGPKRAAMWRRLAVAVCMRAGFGSRRPQLNEILEDFTHENRFIAWTHQWPGPPPTARQRGKYWDLSAFYKQVKKVLGEGTQWKMWSAANRSMLLELLGGHTTDPRSGGRFENCPDALTYLMVDAMMIQADLPQRAPKDDEQAREWRGERRQNSGFVIYRNQLGISKKCHGYKWVQISSLKLGGLTLIGDLFPANVDERKATLKLLDRLFREWPELQHQKAIYLVGDSLYDHSEQFAYDLTFKYGIHGVFPRHGKINQSLPHVSTNGVPLCNCGQLATIDEACDFPTPLYRLNRNLPAAGQYILKDNGEVVDNARIRWRCPKPAGARCDFHHDTYPRENPRLYTYL